MTLPTGTFTYTSPTTTTGGVRVRIGDTLEQVYSVSDEEITEALSVEDDDVDAAAVTAHMWYMARLAQYIDTSAGGHSHRLSARFQQHEKLHEKLEARAKNGTASGGTSSCYAGGIDKDRVDDLNDDDSFLQPHAKVGQDDYETTTGTYDEIRGGD